ncbi:MAG: peptidoglycan bridge formation glycyltransferase FemA/FemB family protein [bacterium]|nr:peptidoglycan bridge formation glycyltransferase FemA/FemB family protein [bacterium]
MHIQQCTTEQDLARYTKWLASSEHNSLWQSAAWKHYQETLGREVRIYTAHDGDSIKASALVVIDKTIGGLSTWDIPRGPLSGGQGVGSRESRVGELLKEIIEDAKREKCMSLYFSPTFSLPPIPDSLLPDPRNSRRHQQPEATRIIDLTKSEEDILMQMKQKGRYNIKVARKNDVTVKESDDIDAFYALTKETGKRDGFTGLSKRAYQTFLDEVPGSFLLLAYLSAEVDDKQTKPIAGVLSVVYGSQGTYYYGASSHAHRASMAPYLLQWESMQFCKVKGCTSYDLLGTAPSGSGDDHPWKGITAFKEKFGGEEVLYAHEQEIILKPLASTLLSLKRKVIG